MTTGEGVKERIEAPGGQDMRGYIRARYTPAQKKVNSSIYPQWDAPIRAIDTTVAFAARRALLGDVN